MTKLAKLIATFEGFGIAGAIPTVRHNPGDLRHSPHSSHAGIDPNGIGVIDSDEHGWADLERQLRLYADRGMTLEQAVCTYAPACENDSGRYLSFIVNGIGLPPETPLKEALEVEI